MNQKTLFRWLVGGGVIVVAFIAISSLNFGDNILYFYTPKEAQANAAELSERTIKIGALVKPGSVDWKAEELNLSFVLTDNAGSEISVSHKGTPPDMFKENQGVVVEGRIDSMGQNMRSRKLMVKHSEEYVKPETGTSMEKKMLEQSIFKNETY